MAGEVIHIMSDYRSGSTLLDQLLGAHSHYAAPAANISLHVHFGME